MITKLLYLIVLDVYNTNKIDYLFYLYNDIEI